jgi:signal transduction histidine kinase
VREVLSALGGEIHAANRDGGGAVFTIDLPPPSAARPAAPGPAVH